MSLARSIHQDPANSGRLYVIIHDHNTVAPLGKTKVQTFGRSAFGLQTPDGATIPLASQKQFKEKWRILKKKHEAEQE